jgi:hypothetical protein
MRTYTRGVPFSSKIGPSIIWNHIDGPLLNFSDGQMHWLTMWERIMVRLGRDDAESLQRKLRPDLTVKASVTESPKG